jgi:hypothetical protein
MVWFGYIIVNTLNKGDIKDNNDNNKKSNNTENSGIGHCAHTLESANISVNVRNVCCGKYHYIYITYCNYNLAAILCTLETWYVLVYNCKYFT